MQRPISETRPWLAHYPDGIGETLAPRHTDLLSAFRVAVAEDPELNFLCYFDQEQTFASVDADSDALACWYLENGVNDGDRVAIIAQNIPGFVVAVLAAWKVGAVPVPGNPMYRANEMGRILADADPSLILCQDVDHAEITAALGIAGLSDRPLLCFDAHDGTGGKAWTILPEPAANVECLRLGDVLNAYRGKSPPHKDIDPSSLGLILYTSGTTGQAKGAMLRHDSLVGNSEFVRLWCSLDRGSAMLAIAPYFHITGFVCHICAAIVARSAMIITYRFEPDTMLAMIRMWRPSFVIGAITAFNAMMRVPGISRDDMACLTRVYSGGAPIPPALKREIDTALGIVIHPCYGMTETSSPAIFTPLGMDAPVRDDAISIGIPTPGTTVRIIGDDGQELPCGESGEVVMHGPQMMEGYWRKPEETAATLKDGWMHSGDVGFMDADGWVYLVDRKKDVIIASGFKVWPREVEDVLYAYPGVREAAVVGVADAYRGENVKAYVSLADGVCIDSAALIDHCRANLAAYKVPRFVEILPDLPKTVTGKIQRAALR